MPSSITSSSGEVVPLSDEQLDEAQTIRDANPGLRGLTNEQVAAILYWHHNREE